MPGIFGVVDHGGSGATNPELLDVIERMSAAMQYEPSYSAEVISCPALGVRVGRVGFSYETGPRVTNHGEPGFMVVSTGEAVSPRLRAPRPPDPDIQLLGPSAGQLADVYNDSGEDGFRNISGGFAGFLIDRRAGKCILFNDRYGIERIFVYSDGQRTLFSSEAKAILAVAPQTRAIDPAGLAEFLACGGTLGPRSLFRNIEVMPGGTVITFRVAGAVTRRTYFDQGSLEKLEPVSEEQFVAGFAESLCSAVNQAVGSPPTAAISLTGGLDSRMIMGCLDAPRGSVPCYTFGSMYRDTLDVSVSREVAARSGQPHTVLKLDHQFLSGIREIAEHSVYVSDGYIGLSGAAELFLNRSARSFAAVRVTGNWGGELLRGVRAFKYQLPKGDFLIPEIARHLAESAEVFASHSRSHAHPLSYTLFQQMPVQGYGRYSVERSQLMLRAPFLRNDVVDWLYRSPASARRSSDTSIAIVGRRPELLAVPTDMGFLGTRGALATLVRRWERRLSFKAEYLISHGAPNWVAALTASSPGKRIERQFLGLHKFQHFRRWFRTDLSGFVRETLFDRDAGQLAAWVDMRRVESMFKDHVDGRGNYTEEIDKLITVAIIDKTLLRFPTTRKAFPSLAHATTAARG